MSFTISISISPSAEPGLTSPSSLGFTVTTGPASMSSAVLPLSQAQAPTQTTLSSTSAVSQDAPLPPPKSPWECPVCYEGRAFCKGVVSPPCNHDICLPCFYRMYEASLEPVCPLCRQLFVADSDDSGESSEDDEEDSWDEDFHPSFDWQAAWHYLSSRSYGYTHRAIIRQMFSDGSLPFVQPDVVWSGDLDIWFGAVEFDDEGQATGIRRDPDDPSLPQPFEHRRHELPLPPCVPPEGEWIRIVHDVHGRPNTTEPVSGERLFFGMVRNPAYGIPPPGSCGVNG